MVLVILILGIGMIVAGILNSMKDKTTTLVTVLFLIIGMFLIIPGCYCAIIIMRAMRAKTSEDKREFLQQIPL